MLHFTDHTNDVNISGKNPRTDATCKKRTHDFFEIPDSRPLGCASGFVKDSIGGGHVL